VEIAGTVSVRYKAKCRDEFTTVKHGHIIVVWIFAPFCTVFNFGEMK